MGVVYEATHLATHRQVAVKLLSSDLVRLEASRSDLSESRQLKREELLRRFEREARSTGSIDSDHVVQVLDAGTDEDSGVPYMAMELLVGEDLKRLIARLGPLPPALALRIAAQASAGLDRA